MASSVLQRLEQLEAEDAKYSQKKEAWVVWHPNSGETQAEALAAAQAAGVFDPSTQEPSWIISKVPHRSYSRVSSTMLPEPDRRAREMHELANSMHTAVRFEGTLPDPPKPKEPKREPIDYPKGLAPH
jgi:hypothetical protein